MLEQVGRWDVVSLSPEGRPIMTPSEVEGAFFILLCIIMLSGLTAINLINPAARRKDGCAAGGCAWLLMGLLLFFMLMAALGVESVPLGPVEVRPVPAQRHR